MKKRKSNWLLNLLMLFFLAMLLFSGYKLITIFLEYKSGTDEYKALRQYTKTVSATTDTTAESTPAVEEKITPPVTVDFAELKAINPDIVGWFYVEALDLSYPIVQGQDDEYYLHRTFERKSNSAGSIFLAAQNSANLSDPNLLVYGHNMKNGSMFGRLKHLVTKEKYKDSPYFWILTPEGNRRYQIFSLHETSKTSDVYTLFSQADEQFVAYANKLKSESQIPFDVPEFTEQSRIVTLSTCTKDDEMRYVVHGVLTDIV